MGRMLIAGIAGGIVMFVWGAVSHMVLPLGKVGFGVGTESAQTAAIESLKQLGSGEGVYLLPMMEEEKFEDEAAAKAFGERATQSPYAFVVYQPQGQDISAAFPKLLVRQLVADVVAAIVAAFLVGLMAIGALQRALAVGAMGLFAWLTVSVPYWNWYRFPTNFTLAALGEYAIGWFLGGLAIAFLLKPKPHKG